MKSSFYLNSAVKDCKPKLSISPITNLKNALIMFNVWSLIVIMGWCQTKGGSSLIFGTNWKKKSITQLNRWQVAHFVGIVYFEIYDLFQGYYATNFTIISDEDIIHSKWGYMKWSGLINLSNFKRYTIKEVQSDEHLYLISFQKKEFIQNQILLVLQS